MGCRNLHSLLSSQGDLDAGGSQVAGEAFVPEPPGGCGFGDWVLSMWEEQGDSAQILLEKAGQSETARKK